MNTATLQALAEASLKIDLRPQYLKDIEKKQTSSNNSTESVPYFNFLYMLAKFLPPGGRILELGALHGASTSHLAAGCLGNGEVWSIDISLESWDYLDLYDYRPHDRTNIIFWCQDSADPNGPCFQRLTAEQKASRKYPLDLLFVDSIHSYAHCKKELELYVPFMGNGAVVVIDDIGLSEDMEKFRQELPEPKIDLSALHTTGFGGFVVTKISK